MKTIHTPELEIAYEEHGPATGPAVILLHGFPYDIRSYDQVAAHLAAHGYRCLVPFLRGYGGTRFLSKDTMRSGQQAALAHDLISFMDALCLPTAILGGYDWGGRAASIVAALWPERVTGLVSCGTAYNVQDIANAWRPAPPAEETRFWYIYYFNTRNGAAAMVEHPKELCRHLWELWSPTWAFDEATFAATAQSFENPDFAEIVIHSYRHRLGDHTGDPMLDEIEARLAKRPKIHVPTVV